MKKLINYLNKVLKLKEEEEAIFCSLFKQQQFKKKQFLAKEGEYSRKIAFINSGVLRSFYKKKNGDEYNKKFLIENNFVAAHSSLITGGSSLISIQCLTDCDLLVADYTALKNIYDTYPIAERISRLITEQLLVESEKKEIGLASLDAKQRYSIFKEDYPGLEQIIPQYHIASYLGITATQLSRIRAQK